MKNPEFEDISSSSTGNRKDFFDIENIDKNEDFEDIYSNTQTKRQLDISDDFLINDDTEFIDTSKTGERKDSFSMSNFTSRRKISKRIKKRILAINVLLSILLASAIFVTGVMGVLAYLTGDMKYTYIPEDHESLGINTELVAKLPKGITNIALFGLDSRAKESEIEGKALSGLSDSIIVVSINTNENTVKMTSILRDSWVPVEGHGMQKINAAYSYGGAKLAIKTVNKHYGLNITDYVSINLYQLWAVIDILGGIDIHITEAERLMLNDLADNEGFNVKKVEKSGYVHLDGGQAMMYSRIRKIDSESIRAMRQQKVLNCLFEKLKKTPKSQYADLLKKVLKHVETSLDFDEIYNFAPLLSKSITIESKNVPGDEVVARGGIFSDTRGGWVWKYDLDEATRFMHKWIYDIE